MHNFFLWLDFIFNIRPTCFGLYQSTFRSNLFISWMSCLLCADTSGFCDAKATQQPDVHMYAYNQQDAHFFLWLDLIFSIRSTYFGLIQSETRRAYMEIKSNHKNFVHLVGLYTYCWDNWTNRTESAVFIYSTILNTEINKLFQIKLILALLHASLVHTGVM